MADGEDKDLELELTADQALEPDEANDNAHPR
jgi:hypothetical protein